MKVKLKKQVGNRQAGEIIDVDSASARSLVDTKKVATYVDDDRPAEPEATRADARRGAVIVHQVVDEDNPNTKDLHEDPTNGLPDDSDEDGDGGETSAGS